MNADQLLADAAWLKGLALSLAGNADDADDLAQESWIAAWRKAPDGSRSLRPWLTKVVRDLAGMRRRSAMRRFVREQAAIDDVEPARPDALLAQARLHRLLVELVLELGEPVRSTILARFVEGRSAASIARAAGIPESTVRGRLRDGLIELRAMLDARLGDRKAWAPAVLAFAPRASLWTPAVIAIAAASVVLLAVLAGSTASRASANARPAVATHAASRITPAVTSARAAPSVAAAGTAPWWDVPGVVLHPLAGRVVTTDGAAIAGATVQLFGWGAQVSGVPEATLVTDATGAFRFASPRNATIYRLVAAAPGFAGLTASADPRAPAHEQDPGHVVIALERCAATAEGFITDSSGGPIAGATVRVGSGAVAIGPMTTSGADGHYALCLAREDAKLAIGADGYEHVMRAVDATGRQRVDVALAPEAVLSGRVVDAETGEPVANAQVFVAGQLAMPRHVLSAGDGSFELDGVAGDAVNLNVWAADHVLAEPISVAAVAGQRREGIEVRMVPGVIVRGIVRANGKPLAGASIRFDSPTRFGPMTALRSISGPDGRFVAVNVARTDSATVRVDGAEVLAPSAIDTRAYADELAIEVREQPVVRGRVMRRGVPIGGATVVMTTERSSRVPSTPQTRSDADGWFELPAPGRAFELTAESKVTGSATSRATRVEDVRRAVELDLDAGGAIEGRVVDQHGTPVAGFVVAASGAHATTDADGRFSIDQLAAGQYQLAVAVARDAPPVAWVGGAPRSVVLASGDARIRDVRLVVIVEPSTIAGTLVDLAGAPVPDAVVRAAGATTRSDGEGRFVLRVVGPGPFTIDALVGGNRVAHRDAIAGGARDVSLRLER